MNKILSQAALLLPAAILFLPGAGPGGPSAPPRRLPPDLSTVKVRPKGLHVKILEGTLFVPDYLALRPGKIPLFLHFQGDRRLAEANLYMARVRAALYTSNLKGLSGAFSRPFRDPAHLDRILAGAEKALSSLLPSGKVSVGRIGITSFSAGFGAVREILKRKEYFDRIDFLLMADSIYASYLSPGIRVPPVEQMVDFMRFAQRAALGKKVMVVAHGRYLPSKYCGTWETADLLLASVGGKRRKVREFTRRGVPIRFRFDLGGLHLLANDEAAARSHADFFYMIGELLERFAPFRGEGGKR